VESEAGAGRAAGRTSRRASLERGICFAGLGVSACGGRGRLVCGRVLLSPPPVAWSCNVPTGRWRGCRPAATRVGSGTGASGTTPPLRRQRWLSGQVARLVSGRGRCHLVAWEFKCHSCRIPPFFFLICVSNIFSLISQPAKLWFDATVRSYAAYFYLVLFGYSTSGCGCLPFKSGLQSFDFVTEFCNFWRFLLKKIKILGLLT
jgi:hypothetical protein